jgi:hypothetical protein
MMVELRSTDSRGRVSPHGPHGSTSLGFPILHLIPYVLANFLLTLLD